MFEDAISEVVDRLGSIPKELLLYIVDIIESAHIIGATRAANQIMFALDNPESAKDIAESDAQLSNMLSTWALLAYGMGRQASMPKAGFWRYRTMRDNAVRPAHAAIDNTVLPHDDPWWASNYPPNGAGCRCVVDALSNEEAYKVGISSNVPNAYDKGWGFNPLQTVEAMTLRLEEALKGLPVDAANTLRAKSRVVKYEGLAMANEFVAGNLNYSVYTMDNLLRIGSLEKFLANGSPVTASVRLPKGLKIGSHVDLKYPIAGFEMFGDRLVINGIGRYAANGLPIVQSGRYRVNSTNDSGLGLVIYLVNDND